MSIEINGTKLQVTNWDYIPIEVQRRIATVGRQIGVTSVGYAGETETVERPPAAETLRLGDFRMPLVGEFYD